VAKGQFFENMQRDLEVVFVFFVTVLRVGVQCVERDYCRLTRELRCVA
jgi:hypothetical protein